MSGVTSRPRHRGRAALFRQGTAGREAWRQLIVVDDDRLPLEPGETPEWRRVRFRTLGCYPLTGAIESEAATVADIVAELRGRDNQSGRVG